MEYTSGDLRQFRELFPLLPTVRPEDLGRFDLTKFWGYGWLEEPRHGEVTGYQITEAGRRALANDYTMVDVRRYRELCATLPTARPEDLNKADVAEFSNRGWLQLNNGSIADLEVTHEGHRVLSMQVP